MEGPSGRQVQPLVVVLCLALLAATPSFAQEEASGAVQGAPISRNEPDSGSEGRVDYFSAYLLKNAQIALENKRYDQAADFVSRALQNQPQNRELLLLSAEVAEKLEKWADVEDRLSRLLAEAPNDARALAGRGLARWRLGHVEQASEDLNRALAAGLTDAKLRGAAESALADLKAGRSAPAPKPDGESDRARLDEDWSLVVIMEERGDWEWLDRFYTRLLQHSPESGSFAYASRGFARLAMGHDDDAEKDFVAALNRTDLNPQTRKTIEETLDRMKAKGRQKVGGQEDAGQRQEAWPQQEAGWPARLAREQQLKEQKDWDGLERFYSELIEKNPNDTYALSSRGFNRLNLGRYDDAGLDFQVALNRDDLDPQSRQIIEETVASLESGRQRTAEWDEIRSKVAELEAARDWAGLEAYYTSLMDQKPNLRLYALSSRGFARMAGGRLEEAQTDFNETLKSDPDPQTESAVRTGLAEIEKIQLAGRQSFERDVKTAAAPPREKVKKNNPRTHLAARGGGYRDVWADFKVMEEHLLAGRLEALAADVDRLRPLKLQGEERGHLAYFQGELLWADQQYELAHEHYLEASTLVAEKYRQSDILWRLAEYARLKGDQTQAIGCAKLSAAALPTAYWRLTSVGQLLTGYGRDEEAVGYFQRSLALHTPERHEVGLYQEMANTYNRLGEAEAYRDYLRRYIDRATDLYASLDDLSRTEVEDLYDARRVHSYLDRRWGLDSYIFGSSYENSDYSLQMVNELYANIRRAGMIFQPYAQLNGSLASSFSGTYYEPWLGQDQTWTGQSHLRESMYSIAGLRVYPFPHLRHSLSLGLEQVVKIGTQTENDTRLRLNHFWHTGLDLEPYVANWPYAIVMNQAIYSTRNNDLTAFGEVRGGRSLRLDALDDHLVITPHASVVWGYGGQSVDKGQRWSLEAGPGVSLRKWYREDRYNAPQSSADVTVQYRWGLSHERQNVLSVTLSNSF